MSPDTGRRALEGHSQNLLGTEKTTACEEPWRRQIKQGKIDAERESTWGHRASERQLETKKERAWTGFLWTRMKTGHAKQREQELRANKILQHSNPRAAPRSTERPKGKGTAQSGLEIKISSRLTLKLEIFT
jgi:hypothetical protein